MIDIDKLTEAQVRYILKMLIKFQWSDDISDDIMVAIELDDYPQQTTMRKVTMIKKIKIVGNTVRTALRDTTVGELYPVTTVPKGTECPDGITAVEDMISFIDDDGDWVSVFIDDNTGYEVVEEE